MQDRIDRKLVWEKISYDINDKDIHRTDYDITTIICGKLIWFRILAYISETNFHEEVNEDDTLKESPKDSYIKPLSLFVTIIYPLFSKIPKRKSFGKLTKEELDDLF